MRLLENLLRDWGFAVRSLRRTPGFTAVAVITLALGIGVNTAVFSVVHAVLLRPLPYLEPDRLVRLGTPSSVSVPEFDFFKKHSRSFVSLTGYRGGGQRALAAEGASEPVRVTTVTADFLDTLGVSPALGRGFSADELRPGGPQAILLSNGLWRRSFAGDPQVLGRTIRLSEQSFTVIGVLPADFWFPLEPEALVPLRPIGSLSDKGFNTEALARLADGVSLRQAQAEMKTISAQFREAHLNDPLAPARQLTVIPYHEWLAGDVRTNLLLLFGATGLLLLIACSNLANLLLARFTAREKEIGVRLALGSGRRRLLGQFLVENFVVVALGAAAGLYAAWGVASGLEAWLPFNLPAAPIGIDRAVLAFALAVAIATVLAFTALPLLTLRRLNLQEALKPVGLGAGRGRVRLRARNALVVAEVAVSASLLIAAVLLIQSLHRLHQERLGFSPDGLITFNTPIPSDRRGDAAALASYLRALQDSLAAMPAVRDLAAANKLPLDGWSNLPTQREGRPEQSIGGMEVRIVTPGFFRLLGVPLLAGRSFTGEDAGAAPPAAMVNETLARTWWPEGEAVGDRLIIGRYQGRVLLEDALRTVVGIVGDAKTASLQDPPHPTVFIPAAQLSDGLAQRARTLSWVVRPAGGTTLGADIRRAVARVDSRQSVRGLRSLDDLVASSAAAPRFNAWLFGTFAATALLLAAVGVYGLLSFAVAQRRREIGIRMALGAQRADVLTVVLRQGLAPTAVGLAFGLAGAFIVSRSLASLLFGVQPDDPTSFFVVAALLLAVGLAASYLPARRAMEIEPMEAIRYE